jgi:hypothetical protein
VVEGGEGVGRQGGVATRGGHGRQTSAVLSGCGDRADGDRHPHARVGAADIEREEARWSKLVTAIGLKGE